MKRFARLGAVTGALAISAHAAAQTYLAQDVDISPMLATVQPIPNCLPQATAYPVAFVRGRTFRMDVEPVGRILTAIFADVSAIESLNVAATPSVFGVADHPASENDSTAHFHMPVLRAGYSYVRMLPDSEEQGTFDRIAQLQKQLGDPGPNPDRFTLMSARQELEILSTSEIELGDLPLNFPHPLKPDKKPRAAQPQTPPADQPDPREDPQEDPHAAAPAPPAALPPVWYPFFLTRLAAGNAQGTDVLTLAYKSGGDDFVIIVNTNTTVDMRVRWQPVPGNAQALDLPPGQYLRFRGSGGSVFNLGGGPTSAHPVLECLANRAKAAFENALANAPTPN